MHPVYAQLLDEVTDDLERKVFEALAEHAGERVTRPQLVLMVFGVYVSQDKLSASNEDRKIRECIERLQAKNFPILASSGKAGYILTDDDRIFHEYISELMSRREQLEAKVRHLYAARQKAAEMRRWRDNPPEAVQTRLF